MLPSPDDVACSMEVTTDSLARLAVTITVSANHGVIVL